MPLLKHLLGKKPKLDSAEELTLMVLVWMVKLLALKHVLGRALGGLYAGATAGGGVGAMAGLDGITGAEGSVGRSYAASSAGGRSVIKERVSAPSSGGRYLSYFDCILASNNC